MIEEIILKKDKWDTVILADGSNAYIEYNYSLMLNGDVEAIEGVEEVWYPRIKCTQTLGGILQLRLDMLPDADIPIKVHLASNNKSYKLRYVQKR